MKKIIISIITICVFAIVISLNINQKSQEKEATFVIKNNVTLADVPPRIVCKCTLFGKCRASGGGSTCAQSEPGGNIDCSQYDGNC